MQKKLMGYHTDDQILNHNPINAFPHKGGEVILDENRKVAETGKAQQYLNRINFKNKRAFVFITTKAPMYDKKNKLVGIFGVSHLLSIYEINSKIAIQFTNRERSCLTQLLKGNTSKQIAASLKLSTRTIEFYINNIKNKLGCQTKSELVRQIYEFGLATMTEMTTSEPFKRGVFLPEEDDE